MINETTKEMKMKIYLPKTEAYINSIDLDTRRGHHTYIKEREMMNAYIACDKMSETQLSSFDNKVLNHLKFLDS